jgi:hypothetical protein
MEVFMNIKRFTLIMGIAFTAIGLLGFVPPLVDYHGHPNPDFMTHGLLLGLFPINGIHNLIHLAFGLWALLVYKDTVKARVFCRSNAIIYGLLAVIGFIPRLNTVFGFIPIHGNDIWLHAVIAVATGYYGFLWHTQRLQTPT